MLIKALENKYARHLARIGVTLNGTQPQDIQIHDPRVYQRVLIHGTLGLGESYMDGWWDSDALDEFFTLALLDLERGGKALISSDDVIALLRTLLSNLQKISRSFQVGRKHYDTDNRLFKVMLDSYMNYSCGYWKEARDLEQAQQTKMKLSCEKLMLRPGMRVLDIGCGWGGMAKYAAENYGVSVTGITISKAQADYARHFCRDLPVEIKLMDYRKLSGQFDRIYSIGMFEHVGYKNYAAYMRTVRRLLTPDGLFLLHTIGSSHTVKTTDAWIGKYIFPNSMLPSAAQISRACNRVLLIEDWHNFGKYYDNTLMAWLANFEAHWDTLQADYDNRFYRMWKYYLSVCAGAFRARSNQLWQIILAPSGNRDCYTAPR